MKHIPHILYANCNNNLQLQTRFTLQTFFCWSEDGFLTISQIYLPFSFSLFALRLIVIFTFPKKRFSVLTLSTTIHSVNISYILELFVSIHISEVFFCSIVISTCLTFSIANFFLYVLFPFPSLLISHFLLLSLPFLQSNLFLSTYYSPDFFSHFLSNILFHFSKEPYPLVYLLSVPFKLNRILFWSFYISIFMTEREKKLK